MTTPVIGIVGGGMVGCATAALIAAQTAYRGKVILIDAGTRPEPTGEYDLRVVALSAASQAILTNAGAWPAIAATRVSPYQEMLVWDASAKPDSRQSLHFTARELAAPALGHIVENNLIRVALWRRLEDLDNVELLPQTQVEGVAPSESQVTLALDNGMSLRCDLVIAADGAGSPVREKLGISTRGWPYRQKGVVTHVTCERSHDATAWQRFMPGGPLAFLPLADGRCSIVWTRPEDEADRLIALDDASFIAELDTASDRVLGRVLDCTKRAAFPLQLRHAEEYCRHRVALVGDAAHAIHPLAGQGVNLGLLDAAALSDTIEKALRDDRDIGDRAVLRRYERWRKGDNLAMLAALDGINRLFGDERPAVGAFRSVALGLVNALPPARRLFMRRAMGMAGEMPGAASNITRRVRTG